MRALHLLLPMVLSFVQLPYKISVDRLKMKYFLLLLALVIVSSQPTVKTWTLDELSEALSGCLEDACAGHPTLVNALNTIMFSMFANKDVENVLGAMPSPSGSNRWTREEILSALDNHTMDKNQRKYIAEARGRLDLNNTMNTIQVLVPAVDISTWTLEDLTEAINNNSTNPKLITYLTPYKQLKENVTLGNNVETVSITTPVGLVEGANGTTVLFPVKKLY
ncbi:hypothetical protein K1T71_010165 [Dendrolimus kikuchii]|uniref:Uncharacterized protein n=1 Tax=Dendrolimus kikuchii TaxID=765133 RepID=A0ACC1CQU8_9NEOP|nr:hypothetical protein K1T71_010165 [Dendrolimus kikuchii]